jgi:SWI/SNF-related matrix-associated actin-dependent regulator 1 of chromatin subfamily A
MASGQDGIEVSPISNPPPAKRQKTTNSTSQSAATTQNNSLAYDLSYDLTYDSEADSGDELFEGFVPDTPAAASKYETQPTQIIDRSAQKLSTSNTPQKNEVQVPASSPLDGKDTPSKSISPKVYPPGWEVHSEALAKASAAIAKSSKTTLSAPLPKWPGDSDWKGSRLLPQISNGAGKKRSLAQSMAPAGTSYKPPYAAPNNVSIAIDRSTPSKASGAQPLIVNGHSTKTAITIPDDDSNSSEDEVNAAANIQPSTFKAKTASASDSFDSSDLQTSNGNSKFHSIVANAAYTGPQFGATFSRPVSSKPATANVMSSYDGVRKSTLQTNPVHALAVGEDIKLEDISDPKLRDMASRLSIAFPTISILTIRNVLFQTRGNVDDAAHYIARGSTDRLSNDNDYIDKSSQNPVQMFAPQIWKKAEPPKHEQPTYRVPQKTQMKRVLDAPVLSLQERYSSTMAAAKPDPSSVAHSDEPLAPQPLWQRAPLAPPKKKKLVQGRRNPSSPVAPDSSKKRPSPPVVPLDDSEDDSGVASEPPEADPALEAKVLKFLNTCTVEELVELTSTTKEYAMLMIESRPFKEIEEADEVQDPKKTKSGKKSLKQPIGTKIVQSIYDTFEGFDAIDVLVKNCDEIGKPLRQEMSTWGVDSFGAAKSGELDMTCFGEANSSQRDSGIGSPSSRPTSVNGDADDDVKIISSTRKKPDYIKQPEMMSTKDKDGDPLELKDYQIVGLNWLAMMYRHKLSGILADEMGLGKTLQVIALIAHLVETGIPGPHLVICPGSVVENWLREIKKFAPDLTTDIYHGMFSQILYIWSVTNSPHRQDR